MSHDKKELIGQLQKDILRWQGLVARPQSTNRASGLGPMEASFPNGTFPMGTIHEFLNFDPNSGASSAGFIIGLLHHLIPQLSACIWICRDLTVFPPALKAFGIEPDRIIFIQVTSEKEALWVTEEALKCEGLGAVVSELREVSFAQSRRLQLVVETSKVTGFLLRSDPQRVSATLCAARWQLASLPSAIEAGMPGVGFPQWKVQLIKVRNGQPGTWEVQWVNGQFVMPFEKDNHLLDRPYVTRRAV